MVDEHGSCRLVRRAFFLAAVSLLLLSRAVEAQQADLQYKRVNSSDLVRGYVPEGTLVETSGFINIKDGVIGFRINRPSALYRWSIVTDSLSKNAVADLASRCAGDGLAVGGCGVTLRGQVNSKAARSITVHEIVIIGDDP
jgi:hypothetical protein